MMPARVQLRTLMDALPDDAIAATVAAIEQTIGLVPLALLLIPGDGELLKLLCCI